MSTPFLDTVRAKYPVYADVPDDKLALAIGTKYPQYLEHPEFKTTFETARTNAAKNVKLDAYQQIQASGQQGAMEEGNQDFLTSIANDPKGFLKSLPGDIGAVAGAVGKLPYQAATDAIAQVTGEQDEFGGNLWGKGPGAEKFLAEVSKSNPALATVGKLAKGIAETAPMAAIGGLPATVQKTIVRGFTADMLYHAPGTVKELYTELQKPKAEQDADKVTTLISDAAQQIGFGGLGAAHEAKALSAGLIDKYVPKGQGVNDTSPRPSPQSGEGVKVSAEDLQDTMRGNAFKTTFTADAKGNVRPTESSAEGGRPQGPSGAASEPTKNAPAATAPTAVPPEQSTGVEATIEAPAPEADPPLRPPEIPLLPVEVAEKDIKAMRSGASAEAPPDILDTIGDHYPSGVKFESKADHGETLTQAQGRAKELMSHTQGEDADRVLDGLKMAGELHGIESVDELAQAMVSAGKARIGQREAVTKEARQLAEEQKRTQLWQQEIGDGRSKMGREAVPVEQLFMGDEFTVNGQPMRVVEHPVDAETGQPFGVTVEGAYGRQTVNVGQTLHIDEGSLKDANQVLQTPGRVAASGTSAPRAARGVNPSFAKPGRVAGATPTTVKQSLQPPPAVANTPMPKSGPLAALKTSFLKTFAPHRLDAGALTVANILRDVNGVKANELARADEAMHEWRKEFDQTPVRKDFQYDPAQPLPHNYAIIDALEQNRAALPPRYQQLAAYFDQAFRDRIETIQQFAPDALQKLIVNYFPHVWKDPKRAEGVMQQVATKLLAGRKEFLKQRTLPLFRDGLERGLQPVSDNPVDLLLAKMHSMDKFIAWLKAADEYKAIGELKFKYALEPMPEGWRVPAKGDPAFQVQAPPEVTIKEAFDAQLRTRTLELLQKLGVPESRLASLGGKRWGLAYERPEQIKTRFGGPMSVYWHELGHILDYRYNLQNWFIKQGKQFDSELRALADRRIPEGAAKSKRVLNKSTGKIENRPTSFASYVRKAEEKMAVMTEAYTHAPEVFKRIAPTVYAKFDQFIEDHPELHDIRELKPSLRLGTAETTMRLGGTLKLGDWIMRDGPAQVVENYLSPGLSNSAVYRSIRAGSNLLNAAQLGLSAFHVGFTSLDAAISTATTGLVRLSRGDVKGGVRALASSPLAPVLNYYSGKAIQRAMLDPRATSIKALNFGIGKYRLPGIEMPFSQAAHDYAALAVKAGLRATVDPFWQTHFTRNLTRSIHEGGAAWAKTPLQAPMALVEQLMRPIAEYLVPRQKLGVFAQIAKAEMERLGPGADIHQVRAAMAKAADYTEDRMGQMTYENLFYNKVAKDIALIEFRAYGWQLGKYRHLGGAISDTVGNVKQIASGKMPELTHRQLYFVALTATVAAVGGVLHRLLTGQNPQPTMDYFHPGTGQTDANGNQKRLSLPTYMKDLESDWHGLSKGVATGGIVGGAKGLWDATYHRLNPAVSEVVDLLNNKDFYGTQIYNPDEPQWKRLVQQAEFIGKGFVPFSISNAKKLNEGEASFRDKALPFFGVVPATKVLTMTPLESYYSEQFRNLTPSGARTPEQGEQAQLRAKLETDLRAKAKSGQPLNTVPDLQARMLAAGVKSPQAVTRLQEKAELLPIQYQAHYLPLTPAMRGFDLATDAEKRLLAPVLRARLQSAYDRDTLDNETVHRYAQQIIPYLKPLPTAPAAVQTNGLRMLQ